MVSSVPRGSRPGWDAIACRRPHRRFPPLAGEVGDHRLAGL